MRRGALRALAAAAGLALSGGLGCAGHGELLARYDDFADVDAPEPLVEVSAFATAVPAAARAPLLFAVEPTAQDDLIGALADLDAVESAEDLLAVLARPAPDAAADGAEIDRTRFARRLVVSALRTFDGRRSPADRIDELLVRVALSGSDARFVSWDRFSTQEEHVDLGRLSLATAAETELSLAGEGASLGVPAEASVAQAFARERSEEVALRQRRVRLAGVLSEREARLYQQGIRGVDLAGTAQIDVVLRVAADPTLHPVAEIGGFRDGEGGWRGPGALALRERRLRVPRPGVCALAAVVDADYRVRQAVSGDETYSEGDDEAVYARGTTPERTIRLLAARELEVRVFRPVDPDGHALALDGISRGDRGELWLRSEAEAAGLLEWLGATGHTSVRGRRLRVLDAPGLRDRPYVPADAGRLAVAARPVHDCP